MAAPDAVLRSSRSSRASQEFEQLMQLPYLQRMAATIVQSQHLDSCMALVIVFNVVVMILDTDRQTTCVDSGCYSLFSSVSNFALTTIYTIECAVRIYALRCSYFHDVWNLLDFTIVVIGLVDVTLSEVLTFLNLPNVQMLRLFRLARLTRIVRLLKVFPTLYFLVRGFAGAMEAIMWGWMLIVVLLVIWSLVAVDLINPVNKRLDHGDDEWCREAFETVIRATLYFMQTLIAGDSWGACALPIMREEPVTYFLFAGALVSVQLGFTNLILAIIVDRATASRDADNEDVIKAKKQKKTEFAWRMREVLEGVDEDQNGTISLNEMIKSYGRDLEVRETLDLMDVDEDDIKTVFELLCSEGGEVSYGTFVDLFQKAQLQDMRVYLMVMKLQMRHVAGLLEEMRQELSLGAATHERTRPAADSAGDAADAGPERAEPLKMTRRVSTSDLVDSLRVRTNSGGGAGAAKAAAQPAGDADLENFKLRLEVRLKALVHEAVSGAAALARQAAFSNAALVELPRAPDLAWPRPQPAEDAKVWETEPAEDLPLPSPPASWDEMRQPSGRCKHRGSPTAAWIDPSPGDACQDVASGGAAPSEGQAAAPSQLEEGDDASACGEGECAEPASESPRSPLHNAYV